MRYNPSTDPSDERREEREEGIGGAVERFVERSVEIPREELPGSAHSLSLGRQHIRGSSTSRSSEAKVNLRLLPPAKG